MAGDTRRSSKPADSRLPSTSAAPASRNVPVAASHDTPRPLPIPPPQRAGSSHTAYYPPTSSGIPAQPQVPSPPPYDAHTADPQYQQPEVVETSPVRISGSADGSMPELVNANASDWGAGGHSSPTWGPTTTWDQNSITTWGQAQPSWGINDGDYSAWANATPQDIADAVEDRWWDKELMEAGRNKPGPGKLPPGVAVELPGTRWHLYRVTVAPPDLVPDSALLVAPRSPAIPTSPSISPAAAAATLSPTASSSHHGSSGLALHAPPNREDVLMSVPHPHAQYSPRYHCWFYYQLKQSMHLPPMESMPNCALPDAAARKASSTCVDLDDTAIAERMALSSDHLKTHHFHHYPNAVKGSSLSPPFVRFPQPPLQRRGSTAGSPRMDVDQPTAPPEEVMLDVWVCCQCQTHILASDPGATIGAVIEGKLMTSYITDRQANPPPGKSEVESVVYGLETMLRIIENFLFRLNGQAIKIGTSLQTKVGWNDTVKAIFEALGFDHGESSGTALQTHPLGRLHPRRIDDKSPEGGLRKTRLLRAWLELSLVTADWRKRYAQQLTDYESPHKLWVTLEPTNEETKRQIGAMHFKSLPRQIYDRIPAEDRQFWVTLGLTADVHSGETVEYAYKRQTFCDPNGTPVYLQCVTDIHRWAARIGHSSQEALSSLMMIEMSKGRWTSENLQEAALLFGLGKAVQGTGQVTMPDETNPSDIREAFLQGVRLADEQFARGEIESDVYTRRKEDLKEAFRVLSQATGKADAVAAYHDTVKAASKRPPTIGEAYATLEVGQDFDDDTLIAVFNLRVEDAPAQVERMRDALYVIAENRQSDRLRTLAVTGKDEGPPPPESARQDWPRGLQQLGNTCYLNSLLQYFYTIRELRDVISEIDIDNSLEVSDEEIKQDRVGGRLVSRREVERSKKFVTLLRDLFWQLAWSADPAVKPALDLAKLALVTPRDEEEEAKSEGSDTTNTLSLQSGSTLVDEPMPMGPTPEPASETQVDAKEPPSVLGKRPAEITEHARRRTTTDAEMSGSDIVRDEFVVVRPRRANTSMEAQPSVELEQTDSDVVMQDATQPQEESKEKQKEEVKPAPPLPPRKKAETTEGTMMFGKQHDVSECMDNCMFQIEAAMKFGLDKSKMASQSHGSIVKNLFYGKLRQRISLLPGQTNGASGSSIHEKEDPFSQLLVNVADEGYDLYDGLAGRMDDIVEFEGKQARMETAIVDLPPILQIQLQRVQFNRDTMEAYKSNAYMKFDQTICLDRFLASADLEKKTRSRDVIRDLANWRERLAILTKGKDGPYSNAITNTANMLSQQDSVDIDPLLIRDLQAESAWLQTEVAKVRTITANLKQEVENIWKDEHSVEYELCSVFVHRGSSPTFGHYFFYARDLPENPDRWLKYNDQDVSTVQASEVLGDTTGSTANPYMLVYARKGTNVISTIHRTNLEEYEMDTS